MNVTGTVFFKQWLCWPAFRTAWDLPFAEEVFTYCYRVVIVSVHSCLILNREYLLFRVFIIVSHNALDFNTAQSVL